MRREGKLRCADSRARASATASKPSDAATKNRDGSLAETKLLTFALALAAEAPVIAPFSAEVTVITATLGALTVRSIIATLTSLTWLFAT